MTGADFFIIVIAGILTWGGTSRGVIKEFFEFLIVSFNVLLCTFLYGFLSDLLAKYFHLPFEVSSTFSYLFFFVAVAFALWVLSGKAEAAANIPPSNSWNRFGGAVMAFLKAVAIIWGLLLLVSQIPMTDNGKAFFHDSFCVRSVQSLNPYVDEAFLIAGSRRAYNSIHPKIEKLSF